MVLAAAEEVVLELALPAGPRTLMIESATAIPSELGVSNDARPLGLAVVQIGLEA